MQNSLFFSTLEIKYSANSSTQIQVLLEKLYRLTMDEDSSIVVHVSHMAFVAKELSAAKNSSMKKCMHLQYLIVFLFRGTQVTSLSCSNQDLSMDSLTLELEEERERQKEGKESGVLKMWIKRHYKAQCP